MNDQTLKYYWHAIQTIANQEYKIKKLIEKLSQLRKIDQFIREILIPTENVTEVKNGKKIKKIRKFYPGYIFLNICLYDDENKILEDIFKLIKNTQGVIGFVGGLNPIILKDNEIDGIRNQIKESEGKEVPKVHYQNGQTIKIIDGPFLNLTGTINEIDDIKGKLKISVSIFGRFTPLELEYWQVEPLD